LSEMDLLGREWEKPLGISWTSNSSSHFSPAKEVE